MLYRGIGRGKRGPEQRRRRRIPVSRVCDAAFAVHRSRHRLPGIRQGIAPRVTLVATLLVAAGLVGGGLAAASRSAAGASPGPGAVARTAVPSTSTVPSITGPSLVVPTGVLRPVPDVPGALPAEDVIVGDNVYQLVTSAVTGRTVVRRFDLTAGTSSVVAVIPRGHEAIDLAATSTGLAWLETWSAEAAVHGAPATGPPASVGQGAGPSGLGWQIVTLRVADGTARVVASGVNTRIAIGGAGASVNPPLLAAGGTRIVYTLDAAAGAAPVSTRIVIRDAGTATIVRQIDVASYVSQIGLSGQAMFYVGVRAGPTPVATDPNDGTLVLVPSVSATPRVVDTHVKDATIGGDLLAWAREDAVDGSVEVASLAGGAPARVPGPRVPMVPGGHVLSFGLAATAGWIGWIVAAPQADGSFATDLVLWQPGLPAAEAVEGLRQPDFVAFGDGWAIWREGNPSSGTTDTHVVRLTDLPTGLRQLPSGQL